MLRCSKEKKCPYSKFDVLEMLDKLLEKGLIQLPKSKRHVEIRSTNDPRYRNYQDHQSSHREMQGIQRASPATCKRRKNHIR